LSTFVEILYIGVANWVNRLYDIHSVLADYPALPGLLPGGNWVAWVQDFVEGASYKI